MTFVPSQEIKKIKISDLHLWSENPRDPIDVDSDDLTIIKRAMEKDEKWKLSSLIEEMGNYYDLSEIPTVVMENQKYIVYDGNRRVAILKYFQNSEWRSELEPGVLFSSFPLNFEGMDELECNVCNKETAIKNIWRKHEKNSSWGQLERENFKYYLLNKGEGEKSLFLKFDEATDIIRDNPSMNAEIVKNNILTEEKLKEIGFAFDEDDKLISSYDSDQDAKKVLDKFILMRKEKVIQSRGALRYKIRPHFDKDLKFAGKIKTFDNSGSSVIDYKNIEVVEEDPIEEDPIEEGAVEEEVIEEDPIEEDPTEEEPVEDGDNTGTTSSTRKTPIQTKQKNLFFRGETLNLISGNVNCVYSDLVLVYNFYLRQKESPANKPSICFPNIIRMGLRLLIDYTNEEEARGTVGRYITENFDDAKSNLTPSEKSFLVSKSVNKENLDTLLQMGAHSNIKQMDIEQTIAMSIIIGEMLKITHGRPQKELTDTQ